MSLSAKMADDWVAIAVINTFGIETYRHPYQRDEMEKVVELLAGVRNKRWARWQMLRAEGCTCYSVPGDNGACDRHYTDTLDDRNDVISPAVQ